MFPVRLKSSFPLRRDVSAASKESAGRCGIFPLRRWDWLIKESAESSEESSEASSEE
jgi:hypothetical protein